MSILKRVWNKGWHFTIGFIVGYIVESNPFAALIATFAFLFYQLIEMLRIRDSGYFEVKEFGIGFAAGIAYYQYKHRDDDDHDRFQDKSRETWRRYGPLHKDAPWAREAK